MGTTIKPPDRDREFIISPPSWTGVLSLDNMFDTRKPVEVDVGCGKGRFIVSRARTNPDINFIAIDRLLARLRKVHRKIIREELSNVRLLRIEASYAVEYMLPPASVSTYYIFFPDPWPKKRHHKRRLFTSNFLDSLFRTLSDGGTVHVATDHTGYFEAIQDIFLHHPGFIKAEPFAPAANEKTEFETIFLNQNAPIGRCSFRKSSKQQTLDSLCK